MTSPFIPDFIVDTPAPADQMAAHGRIAEGIAQTVRAGRVKIIGVLGDWGSGKSTVVRLVQERLKTEPNSMASFTFDAWQHQSDPQRRAFLETLVEAVKDAYEVNDETLKQWHQDIETLNRQREKTETSSHSRVSVWTALFAGSLILLPLGIRLIGDGTLSPEDARDRAAAIVFALGWVGVATPILLSLAFGITALVARTKVEGSTVFTLLANKGPETRTETRLKDPEPSAIEFRRVFRNIVNKAQSGGRRMVIIVDNLDRLPPEDAVTVWSTVRSIFLGADGNRDTNAGDLPTIIMPLDETAIREIYKSKDEAQDALAKSFIDKTFDVVFHVPKPVLSKRHAYLTDRLITVFGGRLSDIEVHAVGSVYEKELAGNKPPSPRAINSFVNAVAALAMQRCDAPVSPPLIAYYVLKRDTIPTDLTGWVLERKDELSTLGEEWQTGIAALHYGVDLDAAQELFIDEPLREALQNQNLDELKRLALLPGFDRYFLKALDTEATGFNLPTFSTAELFFDLHLEGSWVRTAWNKLRAISQSHYGLVQISANDLKGLELLIASCEPAQVGLYIRSLAETLNKKPGGMLFPNQVIKDGGKHFADAARILIEAANKAELSDFQLPVPGGVGNFMLMMSKDFSIQESRKLVLLGEKEDNLPAWLGAQLVETSHALSVPAIAKGLCRRSPDLDWSPLVNAARNQLGSDNPILTLDATLTLLNLANTSETVRSTILSWGDDGTLRSAFNTIWSADFEAAIPGLAALLMKVGAGLPTPGRSWDDRLAANFDIVQILEADLEALGVDVDLAWIDDRLNRWSEDEAILRQLLSRRLEKGLVPVEHMFNRPSVLPRLLSPDVLTSEWIRAASNPGFKAFLETASIDDTAPILEALLRTDSRRKHRTSLFTALAQVSVERWRHALNYDDKMLALLSTQTGRPSAASNLGPNAQSVLLTSVHEMVAAGDDGFRQRWQAIADWLAPADQAALRARVAEAILDQSGPSARLMDIFNRGGAALLESPVFREQPGRALTSIVQSLITENEGQRWLYANRDVTTGWVRHSPDVLQDELRNQLRSYRDAGHADAEDLLRAYRL